MTISFTPGAQQWLGIGKETTYGIPAAAPTVWIPLSSPKWNPNVTVLTDANIRGFMGTTYQATQGMGFSELSYQTMIYKDSVFQHALAMLGVPDVVVTLAPTTLTKGTTATTGGTLPAGATYWVVTALAGGGESGPSNEITATLTGATSTQILTWTTVTGATSYNVYRGTAAGAENVLVANVTSGLTYTDTGTQVGTQTPPAAGSTYVHQTSLLNGGNGQPQGWTGWLYEGGQCERIPGMVVVDLKFAFVVNQNSTLDVQWAGMPSAPVAPPTNTPSLVPPMPPYTSNILIGNTPIGNRTGCTIDLKRSTVPIPVLNGTQSPLAIFAGPLDVTGTIDAVFQGTTDNDLVNLLTNAQPSLTVMASPQNDTGHSLSLHCNQIYYLTAPPAGSNTSWMTISSTWGAVMNSVDDLDGFMSPIRASLATTTATAF